MHLILMLLYSFQGGTAETVPTPIVDYEIKARLVPEEAIIHGDLVLNYQNQSPDVISDLHFHAYMNASRNNASTSAWEGIIFGRPDKDDYGYLHISEASINGTSCRDKLTWVQATDATPDDRTVFALPLEQPLFPGESVRVTLNFRLKMPYSWNRTGYMRDYFFVAQWFPKIGVWETRGQRGREVPGWNCHANHRRTEYYANFGNYNVSITVPSHYQVGATGQLIGEPAVGATDTTYTYQQERVHDFAWTAWPGFQVEERVYTPNPERFAEERQRLAGLFGVEPSTLRSKPVKITLMIDPLHASQIDRHFEAAEWALDWSAMHLMPYPYETLTMVSPPEFDSFSGGMEYPTLITLGTGIHMPEDYHRLELLLFHEYIHQYFYGLVATNEVEESWMDEGFTDYLTNRMLDERHPGSPHFERFYGQDFLPGLPGFPRRYSVLRPIHAKLPNISHLVGIEPAPYVMRSRDDILREQGRDPLSKHAWKYRNYGSNSYDKPATMLAQLERELGQDTMDRILYTYMQRFAWKHPNHQDLIDVVEEVAGQDMAWFFQPMLHGTGELDFLVGTSFGDRRMSRHLLGDGYRDGPDGPVYEAGWEMELNPDGKLFRNVVTVLKNGSRTYPVDVLVRFDDGEEVRERWAGDTTWHRFEYLRDAEIDRVIIDPDQKILIDSNLGNNSWITRADTTTSDRYKARLTVWFQHILQSFVGGF